MAKIIPLRRPETRPASRVSGPAFAGLLVVTFLAAAALFGIVFAPRLQAIPAATPPAGAAVHHVRMPLCRLDNGPTCVIDGDTFRLAGETIRIADIDTPEVFSFGCAAEKALGDRATTRLGSLLNAGAFSLRSIDRDTDQYGRKLRIVVRDGASLGDTLVAEGLARRWDGARRPWC